MTCINPEAAQKAKRTVIQPFANMAGISAKNGVFVPLRELLPDMGWHEEKVTGTAVSLRKPADAEHFSATKVEGNAGDVVFFVGFAPQTSNRPGQMTKTGIRPYCRIVLPSDEFTYTPVEGAVSHELVMFSPVTYRDENGDYGNIAPATAQLRDDEVNRGHLLARKAPKTEYDRLLQVAISEYTKDDEVRRSARGFVLGSNFNAMFQMAAKDILEAPIEDSDLKADCQKFGVEPTIKGLMVGRLVVTTSGEQTDKFENTIAGARTTRGGSKIPNVFAQSED